MVERLRGSGLFFKGGGTFASKNQCRCKGYGDNQQND